MAETPTQIEPAAGGSLSAVEGDGTKREIGKTNARNAGGGNVGGGNGVAVATMVEGAMVKIGRLRASSRPSEAPE